MNIIKILSYVFLAVGGAITLIGIVVSRMPEDGPNLINLHIKCEGIGLMVIGIGIWLIVNK